MAGQTLTEVRALLEGAGIAPLHRFGQNFLIDLNLMHKLVAAAEVCAGDVVLEVGPGTGSLTDVLLETGARVIAVEIDRGMQEILADRLGGRAEFELIRGDALAGKHETNPDVIVRLPRNTSRDEPHPAHRRAGLKLVANLPYQIATPLLCNLLLGSPRFDLLACTIQAEVGERLVGRPGTDAYGPVSVIVQSLATVKTIARVPPEAFWPRPGVDSIMVLIHPRRLNAPQPRAASEDPRSADDTPPEFSSHDPGAAAGFGRGGTDGPSDAPSAWQLDERHAREFAAFVRECFLHRRQTLRRILARQPGDGVSAMRRARVDPTARPESLPPETWRRLFLSRER